MKEMKITPWEVEGELDYDRLIKQFGTTPISKDILEKLKDCHPILRRGLYFSHRDFDKWLKASAQGKKVSVIIGRGPSQKMHIGHLIPFIVAKSLQDKFNCDVYIPISDDEKFFVKKDLTQEDAMKYSKDNILDLIALGFNPKKTFIFQDFVYTDIYRYAALIAKKITYSQVKAIFGLTPEKNIGWSFYPAVQAAHILYPQFHTRPHLTVTPTGIDQDPFIRLTRDIATGKEINLEKPTAIHSKFIPSLYGESKMSSSGNGVIFLSDDPETIKKKINKYAFSGGQVSIDMHRKHGGNTEIDVSFQYLKAIFESDDKKLEDIKQKYEAGLMLTGELKAILIDKINAFLKEHKIKKKAAEKIVSKFIIKNS
ncbi:MAG: tryptophan--tRNA ligase [Nanoarchaeota archaeon]|nr:tryptophan--tRNA ligase [Nanoarchaeota archaeon]